MRDQVAGKASCTFEDLGEHTVKNLERPVHVFAVHPADAERSRSRRCRIAAPISICVLPFANMSGDPEQEYFSDGISEDIITDLSKVSALWVAARNTAFTFKGKHVDVPQVARQLKVSHVLEGSVRKAGGRVRITAQLIDGATGGHVWAERYDRDLNDIFALQDEISQAIVAALKLKLLPEEKKAIEQRGTTDPEAYKLYLMARQYNITGNIGNCAPQRSDHPPVPPRHRDRPELRASLGADGERADQLAVLLRAGGRRWARRRRAGHRARRESGRGACREVAGPEAKRDASTTRCAKSRLRFAWIPSPTR